MKKAREIYSYLLATVVFIGYFVLLFELWMNEIPTANRDIAMTMLGSLMTITIMIAKHLYDGNKESSTRDEMLYKSTPPPSELATTETKTETTSTQEPEIKHP